MTRSSILARASKRAVRQYVSDYELQNLLDMPVHHGQCRWPCDACQRYRREQIIARVGRPSPSPEAP